MTSTSISFDARVSAVAKGDFLQSLRGILRGVERETLRINPNGRLATTPHPARLGSALTHERITTDFSESLLEFITPPESERGKTIGQLQDLHKFTLDSMGSERLWPLSMPCFVEDQNEIPLAWYGDSNVGKMKRVYRLGLKNRYGSMMQAISGVHFNFSLPEHFWKQWALLHGQTYSTDQVSADYFAMIRNYRRFCWLIPYLFGASPALCSSFLNGKSPNLPFEKIGKGTVYLPYATSLRMSDLGYTNAEQSSLQICYNHLDNYVKLLRNAMYTESSRFKQFSAGEGGNWQQLSHNVLQIENELYSPIRPKQPTRSMEKPSDALARRGVSYIEVRALDVNPFSEVGISQSQIDFLDVFLLTCLLIPSEKLMPEELQLTNDNIETAVLYGRKPGIELVRPGGKITLQNWAIELFEHFAKTAELLDSAYGSSDYSASVQLERDKIIDPGMTLSGKMMAQLLAENRDNGELGLNLAEQYSTKIRDCSYKYDDETVFHKMASDSLQAQTEVEGNDTKSFDTFISDYFSEPPAKKNA
ncbi:glutamate--cysteine ligase [Alteromonas sp. ASW11-130]|uniref:glutamate--cysteine ligase n=1 Tax=Alteromonas sp. ASW11-130 TaxID=3015775 RepID=UPI0022427B0B|nr:glutamate--cysteine ligase [Alteromonas sp. ASW11-130]MCW8093120.1 glutamate--cysteine ligase [Alteromonas sp. ASW11-130]